MTKALITSGGGAKGAFSIGVLRHLILNQFLSFDIISGTSTGSFIAALVAANELDVLTRQYLNVQPDDILNKQNIVDNLINNRPFLFSTTPLQKLIDVHITQDVFDKIMRPTAPLLAITSVSLQTGVATIFTNRDLSPTSHYNVRKLTSRGELAAALLASGSQAGFTPPVPIDGEQFVDGGHRDVIPTRIVVDLRPDQVYVLSNNPSKQLAVTENYTDVIQTIFRAITIFVQDVRENDMRILADYCLSNRKDLFIFEPAFDLDEKNPTGLGFNPVRMAQWMVLGETIAREKMISGPSVPVIV